MRACVKQGTYQYTRAALQPRSCLCTHPPTLPSCPPSTATQHVFLETMNQVRWRRPSPALREPHPTTGGLVGRHRDASGSRKRRLSNYGVSCTAALCIFLSIITVAGYVGYIVSQSPKDLDEQWDDVRSYATWWWSTMRGATPPCTYAGVRHYSWGGAVDIADRCECWLRRCPPAAVAPSSRHQPPDSRRPPQLPVSVSTWFSSPPTVNGLWEKCLAAKTPLTRHTFVNPIRIYEAPYGVAVEGIFSNIRTPMCVQSGRVYAVLPPNVSAITPTYSLGGYENFFTNLTDAVLKRAVKYHPLTTVPAAGVLLAVSGQVGNRYTLMHDGLRGWGSLMEDGFGLGFDSEEDAKAWQEVQKQALILSHPLMDTPPETAHSSEVTRQLANAFSEPTELPFFSIAPLSRARAGEIQREPMYCFCGGFVVPSVGVQDKDNLSRSGYTYMRRVVNRHFGGAPLEDDKAWSAKEVERTRVGSFFYTAAVRAAWPPQDTARMMVHQGDRNWRRRPRLLWIGHEHPRIFDEKAIISVAREIGFAVYVDTQYTAHTSAAGQFYLARYADVVVGFHGVALINAVWLDGTTRLSCRTLVELLPYAQVKQIERVYGEPVVASGSAYVSVLPVDAEFVDPNYDTDAKREKAKRELMGEDNVMGDVAKHPAFTKHRAIYDLVQVEAQLRELYAKLQKCL
ncbi:unspecified product [Leishmania tarentolae]|uniref:Unspecified product n=1 Tax=Leishmania tarentolae TaxID=5689 RepID=A0A640KNH1_LEITA|nr:unspecified product [Leishmania tarentolae]